MPVVRLDQLLKFKAELGVKIYILIYKEQQFASQGNDSGGAKAYLESLSPNIKCIRHPFTFGVFYWSHHEKFVVVDRFDDDHLVIHHLSIADDHIFQKHSICWWDRYGL
jgi:hypothetical protein